MPDWSTFVINEMTYPTKPVTLDACIAPGELKLDWEDMASTFGRNETEFVASELLRYSREAEEWQAVSWPALAVPSGWSEDWRQPPYGRIPGYLLGEYTDDCWVEGVDLPFLQHAMINQMLTGLHVLLQMQYLVCSTEYIVLAGSKLPCDFFAPTTDLIDHLVRNQDRNRGR